jgi:hypothetical protein
MARFAANQDYVSAFAMHLREQKAVDGSRCCFAAHLSALGARTLIGVFCYRPT